MSIKSTKATRSAVSGTCVLAFLSVVGPATGLGGESKSPPPKPAPAPARPAPAPARPGAAPTITHPTQGPQVNNGRPAPNSITMGHGPATPNRTIPPTQMNRTIPSTQVNRTVPPNMANRRSPPVPVHSDRPGPHFNPGTHVGKDGTVYSADSHGSLTHVYNPRTGMNIDHFGGHTRAVVERDGRRVVSYGADRGYEQRMYAFHGQQFAHRTYFDHGRVYQHIYSPYAYHGVRMEAYRPSFYYSPGFYRWAGRPWPGPIHYGWGWQADPWYAYYGPYFAPAPVYTVPALWVTDYVIAANLQAAYAAQNAAAQAQADYGPPSNPAPLTPEVKQQIADEVQHQMMLENEEAQANSHGQIPNGPMGVAALFADNHSHVFVASTDLSLSDASGRPCQISQGDVLMVRSPPAATDTFASATVLASKGGADCGAAANVSVALNDLQDMQNHMRETADEGLKALQTQQGQNGLPPAPADATAPPVSGAFVDAAPTPDPEVSGVIMAQANEADQTEQQAGLRSMNLTPAQSAPPAPSAGPATIAPGQPIAAVVRSIGPPATIMNLGAKQIYVYKNPGMKVTFVNGKVTDID